MTYDPVRPQYRRNRPADGPRSRCHAGPHRAGALDRELRHRAGQPAGQNAEQQRLHALHPALHRRLLRLLLHQPAGPGRPARLYPQRGRLHPPDDARCVPPPARSGHLFPRPGDRPAAVRPGRRVADAGIAPRTGHGRLRRNLRPASPPALGRNRVGRHRGLFLYGRQPGLPRRNAADHPHHQRHRRHLRPGRREARGLVVRERHPARRSPRCRLRSPRPPACPGPAESPQAAQRTL